jgi:hypothetical protein
VKKAEIPDDIKATLPEGNWGKVLGMTPVVMTVIATLLAGLSTSEMTRAQYTRSLAAQQQSKAGDQWAFFQAKRLRGAIQSGALDTAQLTVGDLTPNAAALREFAATLPDPAPVQAALETLLSGKLPRTADAPTLPADVAAALDAIDRGASPDEIATRVRTLKTQNLADALRAAQAHARDFDETLRPIVTHGDRLGEAIDANPAAKRALGRDFAVLRLSYSSQRYDAEAKLNQSIARLYELAVRQTNLVAERHQRRSTRFFYGMLAAQAAVLVSTFAIAARRRSLLWSLAAAAGAVAVSFAAYVYLFL